MIPISDDETCLLLECFKDPNDPKFKELFEGLDFTNTKNLEPNVEKMIERIRSTNMAAGAKERHPDFEKVLDMFSYDEDIFTGSPTIRYWFTKF